MRFARRPGPGRSEIYLGGAGFVGEIRTDSSYPWQSYRYESAKPPSANEIVEAVIKSGFDQLAPIVEAGARALRVTVEQISPTYVPNEANPGINEREYMAQVGGRRIAAINLAGYRRRFLSGMGASTGQVALKAAEQAAIEEVKAQAIQSAANALGTSVPVAGLAVAAVNVLLDPKKAFASDQASLNTATTMAAAGAAALSVPVIGFAIGIGMALGQFVTGVRAKHAAERDAQRMEDLGKFVQSCSDIAVAEAKLLANEIVARGIPVEAKGDGARLIRHYRSLFQGYIAKVLNLDGPENRAKMQREYEALIARGLADEKRVYDEEYKQRYDKAMVAAVTAAEAKLQEARRKYAAFQQSLPTLRATKYAVNPQLLTRDTAAQQAMLSAAVAERARVAVSPAVLQQVEAQAKEMGKETKDAVYDAYVSPLHIGRGNQVRFLLQAARDMRILRKALAAGPSVVSAQQVGQIATAVQQSGSPTYTQAVSRSAAQTLSAVAPGAAQALAAQSAARSGSGSGGGGVSMQASEAGGELAVAKASPTAKVVATVATVGVATGLALLAWKVYAASRAAS